MKYKVLGRRVLVRVKKFTKESKFEGSSLFMPEDAIDQETQTQTKGEVVQLGEGAWLNDDGTELAGQRPPVNLGDIVHFQRYGAVRLNPKAHKDEEYWVVEDKDLFVIELAEENTNE